jgi:3-hydroxypropanoate dehydrogenase
MELSKISSLDDAGLDLIFREAHTTIKWQDKPISADTLKKIYDLAKWGPTASNTTPARFVFVTTPETKERLIPALAEGNVEKTRQAPVTVIVAMDMEFYELGARLFPFMDTKGYYSSTPEITQEHAFRGSTLQAAYFIIAARALGIDCGPMGGFDAEKVNAEFFPDGKWKANFLINLGYATDDGHYPRQDRLTFDEAAKIL